MTCNNFFKYIMVCNHQRHVIRCNRICCMSLHVHYRGVISSPRSQGVPGCSLSLGLGRQGQSDSESGQTRSPNPLPVAVPATARPGPRGDRVSRRGLGRAATKLWPNHGKRDMIRKAKSRTKLKLKSFYLWLSQTNPTASYDYLKTSTAFTYR